jgi:hypothetical protein
VGGANLKVSVWEWGFIELLNVCLTPPFDNYSLIVTIGYCSGREITQAILNTWLSFSLEL